MSDSKRIQRRPTSTSRRVAFKSPPKPAQHDENPGEPALDHEPLLADDEVPSSAPEESPIKVDQTLLSENALYSDENDDPRAELRAALRKPAPKPVPARKSSAGLGATEPEPAPSKTSARKSSAGLGATESSKSSARMEKTASRSSARLAGTKMPEAEADDAEPVAPPARSSQRGMKPGSARTSAGKMSAVDSDPNAPRRSTRSSMQPARRGISLKQKILGGVLALTFVVVLGGYDPFMRYWHTKNLDTGATLDERKNAAESLVSRYKANALETFQTRFRSTDPLLSEASVHGMTQVALTVKDTRKEIIKALSSEVPTANTPGKVIYLGALTSIAQHLVKNADKSGDEQPHLAAIAEALIPVTESADTKLEVRQAAVDTLCTLRVTGVCKQLVKLATNDKDLKEKARRGIAATALPETAGDLLRAAAGPDKELAAEAKRAFVTIRDQAKSEDILPLVGPEHPEDVRREIIEALGKRRDDAKAKEGITTALSDPKPEMRMLALKAVPVTGVTSMKKLADLVLDNDEGVRIANAETLSLLRDGDSQKIVVEAFKNEMTGKTMDAYIGALAKRINKKDLPSINMVMKLMETNSGAQGSLCKALVQLTLSGGGKQREQERSAWSVEKWKVWHARITEREQIRGEAQKIITAAAKQRDANRSIFPKLYEQTKQAVEMLEKARDMCTPDDPEDAKLFEAELLAASRQKDYFFKSSGI